MKRALITGITGQDGSYLAEFLLEKGYEVFGLVRRSSSGHIARIAHILDKITILYGDILDISSLKQAIQVSMPDEVYHLAAQSNVGESFNQPLATFHYNALGTLNLLEVCAHHPQPKLYNAATSEMFGELTRLRSGDRYNETDEFHPRSPYGVSKVAAYHSTVNYREAYGLFACNGILFNHESPRRSEEFVSRKITRAAARISLCLQEGLELGNMTAQRDWGYAPDYVEAMWLMLQQDRPDDYVVATGKTHSVQDFVEKAFAVVGIPDLRHVESSFHLMRPSDVEYLCGDASKAKRVLGWEPKTNFEEMVKIMVQEDLAHAAKIGQIKKSDK